MNKEKNNPPRHTTDKFLIGVDEVGVGALAGPVAAGAVFIPDDIDPSAYGDSKKISKKKRIDLYSHIRKNCKFGIGVATNEVIDTVNIRNATLGAMVAAVDDLFLRNPELNKSDFKLLVDGDHFTDVTDFEYECVIKGDSKHKCIGAASILAKVYRDSVMDRLSLKIPGYLWEKNSGYGTKEHSNAIIKNGLTQYHRRSFCSKFI